MVQCTWRKNTIAKEFKHLYKVEGKKVKRSNYKNYYSKHLIMLTQFIAKTWQFYTVTMMISVHLKNNYKIYAKIYDLTFNYFFHSISQKSIYR